MKVVSGTVYKLQCRGFYLEFVKVKVRGRKTIKWELMRRDNDGPSYLLGLVHFRHRLKQHTFVAEPGIELATGCLKFTAAFLEYQNEDWNK